MGKFKNIARLSLFAVPFIPLLTSSALFFPFVVTKALAFRLLIEVAFAAWVVLAVSKSEYRPKKTGLMYSVLAFLGIIFLADIFGVAPVKSLWSNFERMEGFVALLHFGAFFIVATSVFNKLDWHRWWGATLSVSALMVGYSFLQIMGLIHISQGGVRVDGTFGNAAYLAVYILLHIFIALIFLYKNWENKGRRYLYSLLIVSQLLVLYFTATRGAILGLIVGVVVLAFLNLKNKQDANIKRVAVVALVSLLVFVAGFFSIRESDFVANSPVLSRFSNLSFEEFKSQGRYFIWPMALQGIKDRPILGWGQENFIYVFQNYYDPAMYNLEPWFDRAHNTPLDWAIAGGILGLLAYLSLYFYAFKFIWQKIDLSYLEKTIFTSLLVAYFFNNLFVFDNIGSYIIFFALLAYLNFGYEESREKQNDSTSIPNAALVSGGAILVIGFYVATWVPWSTNLSLIEGLRKTQSGEPAKAMSAFEQAYLGGATGKQEILEQIAVNAPVLLQSNLSTEDKNKFYLFAKGAAQEQADKLSQDLKTQIVSGVFLASTGDHDNGLLLLERAKILSPKKQDVYFNLGSVYFSQNNPDKALETFKMAYELAPEYERARALYLVASIYVGRGSLEKELRSQFGERELAFNDTILSGYYTMKRYGEVVALLEQRKKFDPENISAYDDLIKQVREKI